MIFDVSVLDLLKEIGHDGSEIIFPHLPDPYRRRAFHVQEMVEPCLRRNLPMVPLEATPLLGVSDGSIHPIELPGGNLPRLIRCMQQYRGILLGDWPNGPHAVAWDKEKVYDPNGLIYDDLQGQVREFWIVDQIRTEQTSRRQ